MYSCCCLVAKLKSRVWLLATPWAVAHQVSLLMGFPRQEYWSELPFPSLGIFPTQWSNLHFLYWQVCSLLLSYQGSQYRNKISIFFQTFTNLNFFALCIFQHLRHKTFHFRISTLVLYHEWFNGNNLFNTDLTYTWIYLLIDFYILYHNSPGPWSVVFTYKEKLIAEAQEE